MIISHKTTPINNTTTWTIWIFKYTEYIKSKMERKIPYFFFAICEISCWLRVLVISLKMANAKKKKHVSKKNKKAWRKHCDITDVEAFLEDQRLEERLGWGYVILRETQASARNHNTS